LLFAVTLNIAAKMPFNTELTRRLGITGMDVPPIPEGWHMKGQPGLETAHADM
jgi:hypothetical protein